MIRYVLERVGGVVEYPLDRRMYCVRPETRGGGTSGDMCGAVWLRSPPVPTCIATKHAVARWPYSKNCSS